MLKNKIIKIALFFTTSLAMVLGIDLLIDYEFYHRSKENISSFEKTFLRLLYIYSREKRSIAFSPDCARYDKELYYTLKPGECYFQGIEFKNLYHINSLGVRDSEAALNSPEIVFIGDSHTMGWGVDQNKTFPKIIEKTLRLKTLNMGIASYSTFRELHLLKRVDVRKIKYLIIQYNDNDYWENFFSVDSQLRILSEATWQSKLESLRDQKIFLGSHIVDLWKLTYYQILSAPSFSHFIATETSTISRSYLYKSPEEHVQYFTEVLKRFLPANLKNVKIIVFGISNEIHPEDYSFSSNFGKLLALKNIKNLKVLNISKELNVNSRRLVFDNHINEKGHEFVAEEITKLILANKKSL